MPLCRVCGAELTTDDIGAYRKFRDRRAEEFLCIPCFAKELCTTPEFIRERVAFLKRNGCLLFPDSESNQQNSGKGKHTKGRSPENPE